MKKPTASNCGDRKRRSIATRAIEDDRPASRPLVDVLLATFPPPSPPSTWIATWPARSKQAGAARPFVFRAQHRDRHLRRIRIRRYAVLEQVFGSFLDLDVTCERRDDGLVDALRLHFLDDLDDEVGEHHRRRDDRVPVAEDERMDPRVLEAELDRVLVRRRRLAAGDLYRVPAAPNGGMNLRNAASRS